MMVSDSQIRTLEVFNTLDIFKRKEFKLIKKSIGNVAITTSAAVLSTSFLPDPVSLIPALAIGIPAITFAFKNTLEADKVSNHSKAIFDANYDIIMDFKLNSSRQEEEFRQTFPALSKSFMPIKTSRK